MRILGDNSCNMHHVIYWICVDQIICMSILLLINDSFGKVEARKRRHDASDIIHGDVRTCTRHFAPVEHAKYIHGKGRKCCKATAKSNAGLEP